MLKYSSVYKSEETPKRTDVLWVHHAVKNDLTSPVISEVFSKGKWVDISSANSGDDNSVQRYDVASTSDVENPKEGDVSVVENTQSGESTTYEYLNGEWVERKQVIIPTRVSEFENDANYQQSYIGEWSDSLDAGYWEADLPTPQREGDAAYVPLKTISGSAYSLPNETLIKFIRTTTSLPTIGAGTDYTGYGKLKITNTYPEDYIYRTETLYTIFVKTVDGNPSIKWVNGEDTTVEDPNDLPIINDVDYCTNYNGVISTLTDVTESGEASIAECVSRQFILPEAYFVARKTSTNQYMWVEEGGTSIRTSLRGSTGEKQNVEVPFSSGINEHNFNLKSIGVYKVKPEPSPFGDLAIVKDDGLYFNGECLTKFNLGPVTLLQLPNQSLDSITRSDYISDEDWQRLLDGETVVAKYNKPNTLEYQYFLCVVAKSFIGTLSNIVVQFIGVNTKFIINQLGTAYNLKYYSPNGVYNVSDFPTAGMTSQEIEQLGFKNSDLPLLGNEFKAIGKGGEIATIISSYAVGMLYTVEFWSKDNKYIMTGTLMSNDISCTVTPR